MHFLYGGCAVNRTRIVCGCSVLVVVGMSNRIYTDRLSPAGTSAPVTLPDTEYLVPFAPVSIGPIRSSTPSAELVT